MKKIKLFKAQFTDETFRSLCLELLNYQYNDITGDGFRISEIRDGYASGIYIQKRRINEEIVDPFGNNITFTRVYYDNYEFILTSEFPQLTIFSQLKTCHNLFTKLSVLSNFKFFITELDVDIAKLLKRIESNGDITCVVNKLSCSNIELSTSSYAQIFFNGSEDVRKYVYDLIGVKKYTIDKAKFISIVDGKKINCEISKSGTICFNNESYLYAQDLITNLFKRSID